jgi:hypothetical protein
MARTGLNAVCEGSDGAGILISENLSRGSAALGVDWLNGDGRVRRRGWWCDTVTRASPRCWAAVVATAKLGLS